MAYSNAIFYIDLENGSDTARSTLTGATATPYYDAEGAELVPALTTGNWSLGTGWQYLTTPDRLDKNADGAVQTDPVPAIYGTIGYIYKVTITIDSFNSVGTINVVIGGSPFGVTSVGTHTGYCKATTNGGLYINNVSTTSRFTISALSVKRITYNSTDNLPVNLNYTSHGQVTGSLVTTSGFSTYINGNWKVTRIDDNNFTLDNCVWTVTGDITGNVVPFGGGSWTDAWKTITSGATAARIAAGDTIRISKTPDPVSIGNGTWTDCPSGGFAPTTVNVSATANNGSGLIRVTTATHGYSTGDVVLLVAVGGTVEANGAWKITQVSTTQFDLDDSVYTNAWTSGGTSRKINSKAVVLATADLTKNIDRGEANWSNGVDGTASLVAVSTDAKSGGGCVRVTMDAATNANSLQAYKATGTLNLSAYQKISFWFKNSAAVADATTWTITLCSDTAGATPVDTFVIPAIPSTARWLPLTIARTGGGNLGSSIQSIALNSGATAPTNACNVLLDNFIACTTSGVCLQALISKNGSAQGGTEGYYGIQSINGKVVVLDNDTNTVSTAGIGYSGTSETVTTYIRSTYKTAMAASGTTQVSVLNDSGTLGSLIAYEFGYEVGTTNQNGETFLDGLNGNGYGIYASSKQYNSLNWCSCVRYNYGINFTASNNNTINAVTNANNNTNYGIYFNVSNNNTITTVTNAINNGSAGINFTASNNNTINAVTNANNNTNYGIIFSSNSSNHTINTVINANNNANYGIIFSSSSSNTIKSLSTTGNSTSAIYNDTGTNFIRNATMAETTQVSGMTLGAKAELWSFDEDGTEGNNWGYFYGGTFNWQTDTKHASEAGAWKTAITSSDRKSNYKAVLPIGEVGGIANTNLTATYWVKKDHATNIACRLVCYADTALNITEQSDTKADDTDWEQLSVTVNSDHANPVFQFFLETWWVAGTSNSYVGTLVTS